MIQTSGAGEQGEQGGMTWPEAGIGFDYAFQPIVELGTRSIFAYEALVRGPHGEPAFSILSRVSPRHRYSFDMACRAKAVRMAARLGVREYLAINFFPNAVFGAQACIRSTLEEVQRSNFPVEKLIFEVSEAEQVHDREYLASVFREYRRLGFSTAIDDFGAGYAGLNLLAEYQPDIIKIDMGLVRGIDRNRARQAIVHGVIDICRKLGKRVLAEGVETKQERDFLHAAGIGLMQGFLFGKPAFRALGAVDPAAWD